MYSAGKEIFAEIYMEEKSLDLFEQFISAAERELTTV